MSSAGGINWRFKSRKGAAPERLIEPIHAAAPDLVTNNLTLFVFG
jgi:hypothetical protein